MRQLLSNLIYVPISIAVLVGCATAEENWQTLTDRDLTVAAGSALDFSALVAAGPAGRNGWVTVLPSGHIGFERRNIPERFLCASITLSGLTGGVPDKAGSEQFVRQLTRTGYNLVRLTFVDAHLMTNRSRDFDFDPEQFDRLHYLLAQLKAAGIYWVVDGMTSDNGAWGNVEPHRWVNKYRAKMDVLTDPKGFAHWAALVERLWGAKNPYTGIAPMQDPAMLGMILINEGSFFYLATDYSTRYPALPGYGKLYPDQLAPQFRDWLKTRYGTDTALRTAWGKELKGGESVGGRIDLPGTLRGSSPRDIDFARFITDLEQKGYRAMDKHVRDLGFKGLITAFDNWSFIGSDITRSGLQWVDMHSYPAVPSNYGDPGSKLTQASLHQNTAHYVRELSNSRQWGKPFTVTEYGQPFWNQWRHESAVLMPAVAAHQGWDAISQFAESPVQFDYGQSPYVRRQAIYPFAIGADPIAHAGERLAAMLYLRGDVASSQNRIRVHVDAEKVLARSGGWEQLPEPLSKLAFISPSGLDFGQVSERKPGELWVNLTGSQPWWLIKSANGPSAGRDLRSDAVAALQDAGLIGSGNRSRPDNQLFQSDTGQLVVDSGAGLIQVATDRTVVLVLKGGNASAGALSVSDASGPALFAVSSLDKKPIAQSRHLLLWVLTDAINTGMTFEDAGRTTIKTLGKFPPQVQTISATLRVAVRTGAGLKAWPLALGGVRRQAIPLVQVGDAIELHVDTAALPDGPALFFEIAKE